MLPDWKVRYNAAIREQDAAQLLSLAAQARLAIHTRVLELRDSSADEHEREELDEALRQITLHLIKPRPAIN